MKKIKVTKAKHNRKWQPKLRAATFADRRTKRRKTRQKERQRWMDDA